MDKIKNLLEVNEPSNNEKYKTESGEIVICKITKMKHRCLKCYFKHIQCSGIKCSYIEREDGKCAYFIKNK